MKDKFEMKELCEKCEHVSCCTGFDAPFLFENDIKKLSELGKEEFIEEIKVANMKVKSLKKKSNSTNCVFWDERKRTCQIYEDRPFDCKMFPFDIMKIDEQIMWIVFSCNEESSWEWSEKYLQKLEMDPSFVNIVQNIGIFQHTLETEFSENHPLPYKVIRKVNFRSNSKD